MSDYGVKSTGYVRKPLAVILAELQSAMITEFGPGVIQTPQSPFGQLNGLMADLIAEIDERNLDIYQSVDPDQAEGNRLDVLGRIRDVYRGDNDDVAYRQKITNKGYARIDVQDLQQALTGLDGVTYAKVFVNETGEITNYGLSTGSISTVVIGGSDEEIAEVMRKYVVPGVNTYGNVYVTSTIDGYCRSMSIIRPIDILVNLTVTVRTTLDTFSCPAPSLLTVRELLVDNWNANRINGQDISNYAVRSIIESAYSNIEVISIVGSRDGESFGNNQTIPIAFTEIGSVSTQSVNFVQYEDS